MLRGLFGTEVSWVVAQPSDEETPLLLEEQALTTGMVPHRLREFTTGRSCARRALAALGLPPVPILVGPRREPLWPDGIVGTIAHCRGFCACAVARSADLAGIGLDVEPVSVLEAETVRAVAGDEELQGLKNRQPLPGCNWGAVLFVAKEAVFKAMFPLTHAELEFQDVRIHFDQNALSFTASALGPQPSEVGGVLTRLRGRVLAQDRLLLAGTLVTPR